MTSSKTATDWICNAIICICPLDRHSRDDCLGLHWAEEACQCFEPAEPLQAEWFGLPTLVIGA